MCFIFWIILLIISPAVFVYLGYTKASLIRYENLPNMFMGIGLFIFIMSLDRLNRFNKIKDNSIGSTITALSVCSYRMFFSQVIVVKELSYHNPESNLPFHVMFVLIVFLSWLLPYVLSKIPYVKRVSGV